MHSKDHAPWAQFLPLLQSLESTLPQTIVTLPATLIVEPMIAEEPDHSDDDVGTSELNDVLGEIELPTARLSDVDEVQCMVPRSVNLEDMQRGRLERRVSADVALHVVVA